GAVRFDDASRIIARLWRGTFVDAAFVASHCSSDASFVFVAGVRFATYEGGARPTAQSASAVPQTPASAFSHGASVNVVHHGKLPSAFCSAHMFASAFSAVAESDPLGASAATRASAFRIDSRPRESFGTQL